MGLTIKRIIPVAILIASSILFLTTISACSQSNSATKTVKSKSESKQKTTQLSVTEETNKEQPVVPQNTEDQFDLLKKSVYQAMALNSNQAEQKFTDFVYDNQQNLTVKFKIDENATQNLRAFSIKKNIADILNGVKKSGVPYNNVNLITFISTFDQSGKTEEQALVNITYSKEAISQIDFESFNIEDILKATDTITYLAPSLK